MFLFHSQVRNFTLVYMYWFGDLAMGIMGMTSLAVCCLAQNATVTNTNRRNLQLDAALPRSAHLPWGI